MEAAAPEKCKDGTEMGKSGLSRLHPHPMSGWDPGFGLQFTKDLYFPENSRAVSCSLFMRNLFLGLLFLSLAGASARSADTVIEQIVARVNNQIITQSEYQRNLDEIK